MHFGAQKELFMRKVAAVETLWRTERVFHAKSCGGGNTLVHRRGVSCEKLRRMCKRKSRDKKKGRSLDQPFLCLAAYN